MERTNARYLKRLPELVNLVTVDASFISLGLLFPAIERWTVDGGDILALVKPQFEAGKDEVKRGGVVRDPQVHRRVLVEVMGYAREQTLMPMGVMRSPLEGPKGNIEFLLWCKKGGQPSGSEDPLETLFFPGGS
jgi:23S rRNA (cytidine1920-2'-O)/16S rRNA (cytidine1409-2'-O)-methyltransferase